MRNPRLEVRQRESDKMSIPRRIYEYENFTRNFVYSYYVGISSFLGATLEYAVLDSGAGLFHANPLPPTPPKKKEEGYGMVYGMMWCGV